MYNGQINSLNFERSVPPSNNNGNTARLEKESLFELKALDDDTSDSFTSTSTSESTAADEDKSAEMDTNGDGKITQEEIDAYNAKQASDNEDKTAELDKNGDGKITQAEIDAYNAEHASSSAEKADEDANLTPEQKLKNERIAKLDKAEAEVYKKYQDMIDKLEDDANVRDAIFEFMDGLSDDELTSFLNAYNIVDKEDGGTTELCCDLFAELLNDDGTKTEYKTFKRLSNILSHDQKLLVYVKLNQKMEDSISRMTYHTQDGKDSGIPNETNQKIFRNIYKQQLAAFRELLFNGNSTEIQKYITKKNSSLFEYDGGHAVGNGVYAPRGMLIQGKYCPDTNWDYDFNLTFKISNDYLYQKSRYFS